MSDQEPSPQRPDQGDRSQPMPPCRGHMRHWFVYRGIVGSSAPTCVRRGCEVENPRYRPEADPYRVEPEVSTVDQGDAR